MGSVASPIVLVLRFHGNTVKFFSGCVFHEMCFGPHSVILIGFFSIILGGTIILGMACLLDEPYKLIPEHIRFLEFVEHLLGFINLVTVINAANLKTMSPI